MNDILGKLSEYLEAAEGLVVEYAPEAAQLVLRVVQLEAIFYLLLGTAGAIMLWPCIRWFLGGIKQSAECRDGDELPHIMQLMAAGIGACTSIILVCANLFSFYYWLAAFNPLAGLVYKLIN